MPTQTSELWVASLVGKIDLKTTECDERPLKPGADNACCGSEGKGAHGTDEGMDGIVHEKVEYEVESGGDITLGVAPEKLQTWQT